MEEEVLRVEIYNELSAERIVEDDRMVVEAARKARYEVAIGVGGSADGDK